MITLLLLFAKHFIVDFALQNNYQLRNKGTYGHLGGILHAGIHGLFTAVILSPIAGILDMIIHYHIDYAKVRLSAPYNPYDKQYWWLFGIDQYLHIVTYLLLYALL